MCATTNTILEQFSYVLAMSQVSDTMVLSFVVLNHVLSYMLVLA